MYKTPVALFHSRSLELESRWTKRCMPVIAIVNEKGGTGKTTLSTNLAVAFARDQTVFLLDADAQGSSRDWAESQERPMLNVHVRAAEPRQLMQDVRRLALEYSWVIIDGPAGISRVTADAVRAADMVLIPAKPSPYDVWAAATIVEAVKARQSVAGGRPKAAFVITMAKNRTLLGRQIEAALQDYGLPTLETRTTDRVSYAQTAIEGRSVLDGRDRVAQGEILSLKGEIERLINDAEP